jgi:hypothetical protein
VPDGQPFCGKCGTKYEDNDPPPPKAPSPSKKAVDEDAGDSKVSAKEVKELQSALQEIKKTLSDIQKQIGRDGASQDED